MEQYASRLSRRDGWTWIGGRSDGKKDYECIVRAFDAAIRFTDGEGPDALPADDAGVVVPAGEGRRLVGRHFFARPLDPRGPEPRISLRGLPDDALPRPATRAS